MHRIVALHTMSELTITHDRRLAEQLQVALVCSEADDIPVDRETLRLIKNQLEASARMVGKLIDEVRERQMIIDDQK